MAAGDLTTMESVRAYLRGQVPLPEADEALVEGLITAVSKMFVAASGSDPVSAAKVDTWSGTGSSTKFLDSYPVVSVESVEVDGVQLDERQAVGEDGWVVADPATGKLELIGYEFSKGIANCVVHYTAGYGAEAPADVAQACTDQVGYLYKAKERIGVSNETTQGGGSVTYLGAWTAQQGKGGWTPLFAATVERYRKVC